MNIPLDKVISSSADTYLNTEYSGIIGLLSDVERDDKGSIVIDYDLDEIKFVTDEVYKSIIDNPDNKELIGKEAMVKSKIEAYLKLKAKEYADKYFDDFKKTEYEEF